MCLSCTWPYHPPTNKFPAGYQALIRCHCVGALELLKQVRPGWEARKEQVPSRRLLTPPAHTARGRRGGRRRSLAACPCRLLTLPVIDSSAHVLSLSLAKLNPRPLPMQLQDRHCPFLPCALPARTADEDPPGAVVFRCCLLDRCLSLACPLPLVAAHDSDEILGLPSVHHLRRLARLPGEEPARSTAFAGGVAS